MTGRHLRAGGEYVTGDIYFIYLLFIDVYVIEFHQ